MNRSDYFNGLALLIILVVIIQITVRPVSSQQVITTKMSSSEFVGYVPDQIVVNLGSFTVLAINKSTAFQSGTTGIERLDRLGQQLNVSSLV